MGDLHLSSFKFSLISTSTYLLMYGMMQIPVGLIADRYGLKQSLFIGAIICSLSTIGFSYCYDFYSALFFRVLTGLGSSFGFICLLIAVYEWMPRRNIALLIGASQFIGTMGPMIAAGPINSFAEGSMVTWRHIFLFFGISGLVLTGMIFLFVKNKPRTQGNYLILRRPGRVKGDIKQLFSKLAPWGIALFSAFIYFSIEFLSENDGKFFLHLKGFSSSFSSYMITVAWLGYAIGCPLFGFLSDYFQRRKSLMIIAAIIGFIAITTIVFAKEKYSLITSFFFLGISASGQSIGFVTMAEQFKKEYLAIGLALNNSMITVVSSVNAPIIGFLIDSIKTTNEATLEDYQTIFCSLIFITFLSLFLAIFSIKETFCKSSVDLTYLKNNNSRIIN